MGCNNAFTDSPRVSPNGQLLLSSTNLDKPHGHTSPHLLPSSTIRMAISRRCSIVTKFPYMSDELNMTLPEKFQVNQNMLVRGYSLFQTSSSLVPDLALPPCPQPPLMRPHQGNHPRSCRVECKGKTRSLTWRGSFIADNDELITSEAFLVGFDQMSHLSHFAMCSPEPFFGSDADQSTFHEKKCDWKYKPQTLRAHSSTYQHEQSMRETFSHRSDQPTTSGAY